MARYAKTNGFCARPRWRGLSRPLLLAAALGLGSGIVACRTNADDIERWTTTAQGPRKLIAVITHDKYPVELRVEAAMGLVRMKPRGGRRLGILGQDDQPGLVATLESLPAADRDKIVSRMIPKLEEEMRRPPAKAQAGQAAPVDGSYPYKDAAFALLTHGDGVLVQNEEMRARIRAALTDWSMTDFAERMDESSQLYGVEQVLRELGAPGVERLPDQIVPGAKKIDRMADLIAELGSPEAKRKASEKLVAIARDIASEHWIKQKAPIVDAANKASKLNPTPDQFAAQLEQYQEEELLRIFASLKKIGQPPAVEYLLEFAKNDKSEKKRAAALAALEGNLDKNDAKAVGSILELASAKDTPDTVRDVALRRVGELPRKLVIDRLFSLFQNDNWKIRWVAGELVLKMSDSTQVAEFMNKISGLKNMAITEPLRYGALMGELKGTDKPDALAEKYASERQAVPVRLTALGYFYEWGTKADLGKVEPLAGDRDKVPSCKEGWTDCEWKCAVGEGAKQEIKDIGTVGEFVQYCVKPAMEKRTEAKKGEAKGK